MITSQGLLRVHFIRALGLAIAVNGAALMPLKAGEPSADQQLPAASAKESGESHVPNAPSVQASPGTPSEQTASDSPQSVPDLGLSQVQKQTIYQSVFNQGAKRSAEPVGFRAAIGSRVPEVVSLAALPKTIIDLIPKLSDYNYAFVANQVLIVDPQSRIVVEVIRQ